MQSKESNAKERAGREQVRLPREAGEETGKEQYDLAEFGEDTEGVGVGVRVSESVSVRLCRCKDLPAGTSQVCLEAAGGQHGWSRVSLGKARLGKMTLTEEA